MHSALLGGLGFANEGVARTAAQVARLATTFDNHELHQLAYHTMLHEVLRHDLVVRPSLSSEEVPPWAVFFVRDAIRAILITGYFYHGKTRDGHIVADVSEVIPGWRDAPTAGITDNPIPLARKAKWTMHALETPFFCCARRQLQIRSGGARARAPTVAITRIEDNWQKRDALNANPAVYTTVSDKISATNPGDRMWFRHTANPDVVQTNATDINRNFSQLVSQRADTIMQLDSITTRARDNRKRARPDDPTVANPDTEHTEFIVSDGRAYTEVAPRNGQADTLQTHQGHANAVLFAYGVPPQALGRNINTERLASSNRLTEMAVTGFHSTCDTVRALVGRVLAEATRDGRGGYVDFCPRLRQHELNELLPLMHTDAAVHHIARVYGVDPGVIDPERVDRARDTDDGGGRKGATKPRTPAEAAAATRQRENKPHA